MTGQWDEINLCFPVADSVTNTHPYLSDRIGKLCHLEE